MVKEHVTGKTIVNISNDAVIQFFSLMVKDFRNLKSLYNDLESFEQGQLDDDEILETIDATLFVSVSKFVSLAKLRICANESLNIYFGRVANTFADLDECRKKIADTYCAPDKEEASQLKDLTYKVLAGFCFIIGNEFGCFDTVTSSQDGEPVIDEVVYHHYSKFAIAKEQRYEMCVTFAKEINDAAAIFKIKLDVFDEAPEKEEMFLRIVGPDIGAIDETLLTMQMVDDVIEGKLNVDQLLEGCIYTENYDSDEEDAAPVASQDETTQPQKMEV